MAMDRLKEALTTPPTLVSIDYVLSAGSIIVTVDASKVGWGRILQQKQADGKT